MSKQSSGFAARSLRNKSLDELRRELESVQQMANKPGLDAVWKHHRETELASIQAEIKKRTRAERSSNASLSNAEMPATPGVADAAREPYSTTMGALLRQLPAAGPNGQADATALPPELREAMEGERSLYRPLMLKRADEVEVGGEKMVSLVPHPAADPSWCGGTLLAFSKEGKPIGGDIIHMDTSTGRIYASFRREQLVPDDFGSQVDRWCYLPFDFSTAMLMAASAYPTLDDRLRDSLAGVQGRVPAQWKTHATYATEPERLWGQRWGLLWGPPGTGKTETMASLLADAVRTQPRERILAIAPTNRAVDNLALRVSRKLHAAGALLRSGGGARVFRGGVGVGAELTREFPDVLHEPGYQALIERVEQAEMELRHLEAQGAPASRIAEKKESIVVLRKGIRDETHYAVEHGGATLILVTIHRALRLVSELAGKQRFARVVMDEAGMVTRAATALLVPLGRQVTLAGDPKQIGPVCRAAEGASAEVHQWLRCSPLSHLEDASTVVDAPHVLLLRTQHRMHPEISTVVSRFSYSGMLNDGEGPRTRRPAHVPNYPVTRANWVVLDHSVREARRAAAERGESGRGYQRKSSAEITVTVAADAVRMGLRVLAVTPYRAQAELLRREGTLGGFTVEQYTASTIHRQQGTEFDVVIVDTVAAGRPFSTSDLTTMLNVAASRAREYLFVIASLAEAEAAIPSLLLRGLAQVTVPQRKGGALQPVPAKSPPGNHVARLPRCLGAEIAALKSLRPLFSQEQIALFERRTDEGHHLVRGVAGSGKTYVLAHWVARWLREKPDARILVSYFNKALAPLMNRLVREALQRDGREESALRRIDFQHVHATRQCRPGSYDAVFVDEAQDMGPQDLRRLYELARLVARPEGKSLRAFFLFMDDSQNIYGNQSIEEMKEALPAELSFAGRTRVLREAFRSTRQILDLAFNVVLDPKRQHVAVDPKGVANPGMREFMRVQELKELGRLEEPTDSVDELFHVTYTEREGVVPILKQFESEKQEMAWLAAEVRSLLQTEQVRHEDILIVSPSKPLHAAQVLERAGIPSVAYGGSGGQDSGTFPTGAVSHVRVTTLHSCKGHECPVVFFIHADGLDDVSWMNNMEQRTPREQERIRRALFYVGATRAMVRQYISGKKTGRLLRVAAIYADTLGADTKRLQQLVPRLVSAAS
ncbi:AAA domain-containing protein [Corallococcus exiguus]|uniref:AAA domain-containing protein n=1 Tax=Corallococcus exiguus TaxID=83462 RepID=UPI001561923E|nr:AAA domain-containing protein [Corallococcus exiguus]NRD44496.1 AAA family ATPase [Corallococcus exiguus]